MFDCPQCGLRIRASNKEGSASQRRHQASKQCALDADALRFFEEGYAPVSTAHPILKLRDVHRSYRRSRVRTDFPFERLDPRNKIYPAWTPRTQPWVHKSILLIWDATRGSSSPVVAAARDWLIRRAQRDIITGTGEPLSRAITTAYHMNGGSGVRAFVAKVIRGELLDLESFDEPPSTEPMQQPPDVR